ncbi:hypothetical protein AC241_31445 (plasmid) [Bacillus thuringiensis]|uniref:DUF3169 family protein n=2 Tax=Bacillus thuringiensis TaxID=1428 RepID=UPI000676B4A4|nr:DUF3169 family protein [Bacillus thuringiensis]AKR13170.1 hypothetical protein AC241_31445 [Bacillus thuringiensis]
MRNFNYMKYIFLTMLILFVIPEGISFIMRFSKELSNYDNKALIAVILMTIFLQIILAWFVTKNLKRAASNKIILDRDVSDISEINYNKSLNYSNISISLIIILNLICLFFISSILEEINNKLFLMFIPLFLTIYFLTIYSKKIQAINSTALKENDIDYIEKYMGNLDEGEIYIHFKVLFKNFYLNNTLLFAVILILSIYSLNNHLDYSLPLILLIILFSINNLYYQYQLKKNYEK